MTEPAALQAIARFSTQRLVLVGDPKQLSPTITGPEPEHMNGLEQTMFDRLCAMGVEPLMLGIQYRMHPRLSAICNELFYEGRLRDGVSAEDRPPLHADLPTLRFFDVVNGQERRTPDGSFDNAREVDVVCEIVGWLAERKVSPADIGVVCLYKAQALAVSDALRQGRAGEALPVSSTAAILVSTVDAFQGGEREVILLTCVRSAHVGFVDSSKRTNVALSRAKRHLFIVGHGSMLGGNATWRTVIEHCRSAPRGYITGHNFVEQQRYEKAMRLEQGTLVDHEADCDNDDEAGEEGEEEEALERLDRERGAREERESRGIDITMSDGEGAAEAEEHELNERHNSLGSFIVEDGEEEQEEKQEEPEEEERVRGKRRRSRENHIGNCTSDSEEEGGTDDDGDDDDDGDGDDDDGMSFIRKRRKHKRPRRVLSDASMGELKPQRKSRLKVVVSSDEDEEKASMALTPQSRKRWLREALGNASNGDDDEDGDDDDDNDDDLRASVFCSNK